MSPDDAWLLRDLKYHKVPELEREIENLKEEVANLKSEIVYLRRQVRKGEI